MSYRNRQTFDLGADSQEEAVASTESLTRRADQIKNQLQQLDLNDEDQKHRLGHDLAITLTDLEQPAQAWQVGFPAFKWYIGQQNWEQAVEACDTLFRSGHEDALIALGHGLWLSITFPVDPALTLAQLQHVIDDTPEDSDGAAVAAAVAAYVVDLRCSDSQTSLNSDNTLIVGQMLNDVARRHSNVQNQDEFNNWFERLELNNPEKFLVRMRNIIDVLVQGQWWFDRAELQGMIPDEA